MQYIPRIDSFRAVAAFSVVYAHYFNPIAPWWAQIAPHGVQFFFVLSGFLIGTLLLQEEARGTPASSHLASFYIRRVFRIFPVYFAVLGAGLALGLTGFRQSWPWTATFTTNIMYCHGYGDAGYFGPAWTLAVEEQFYVLFPLLLLLLPRRLLVNLVIAAVIVAVCYRLAVYLKLLPILCLTNTPAQLDHLGIGVLAAVAMHHLGIDRVERALRGAIWFTLPCFAAGWAAIMLPAWLTVISQTLLTAVGSAFAAWLIVRAVVDGPDASSWGGRWLPFLGSISYAVYLIHNPMLALIRPWEGAEPAFWPRIVAVGATIVVAVASRYILEKPMINLGRRLARTYTRPSRAAVTA